MKNKSFLLIFVFFGLFIGGGFAQDETDYGSESESSESSPDYGGTSTPSYTPATPAYSSTTSYSSSSGSDTKAPRTGIYDDVMQQNVAIELSTDDYITRPHLIGDKQFIAGYSSPNIGTLIDGAFAFSGMGLSWFGAMENWARTTNGIAVTNSRLRAGIGTAAFGIGIMYELNKWSTEIPTQEEDWTEVGDAYGVFGSFSLGGPSVWASLSRETSPDQSFLISPTGAPDEEQKSVATSIAGGFIKDSEGEGSHAFSVGLDVTLDATEYDTSGMLPAGIYEPIDESSMALLVVLGHGVPLKQSDDITVVLGANAGVIYGSFENKVADGPAEVQEGSGFAFVIAPNLGFQKQLGKGFEALFGASANLFTYSSTKTISLILPTPPAIPPPYAESEGTNSELNTNYNGQGSAAGEIALGLRWVKDDFAIEGQLSKSLIRNGPWFIGGAPNPGPGLFISVGLSVGF